MAANVNAPAIPCAAVVCRKILSKWPTVLLSASVVVMFNVVVVVDNTVVFPEGTGVGVGVGVGVVAMSEIR